MLRKIRRLAKLLFPVEIVVIVAWHAAAALVAAVSLVVVFLRGDDEQAAGLLGNAVPGHLGYSNLTEQLD